ncbi:hypothetical protein LX36DRAFT_419329 [Colletotrichum falcatum]|nr:hypothetical protein LX36DRAFT_419329 [Colletotrichum falcatum]
MPGDGGLNYSVASCLLDPSHSIRWGKPVMPSRDRGGSCTRAAGPLQRAPVSLRDTPHHDVGWIVKMAMASCRSSAPKRNPPPETLLVGLGGFRLLCRSLPWLAWVGGAKLGSLLCVQTSAAASAAFRFRQDNRLVFFMTVRYQSVSFPRDSSY